MSGFTVRFPGLYTTVQDLGRFGRQSLGVPPSGALDADALETANLLVGNVRNEACLECVLKGPELEFVGSGAIAVCGADMEVRINGNVVPRYETLAVRPGDIVSLGTANAGIRTYIAFSGGLDIAPVLGSRSTYARAGFGGFQGRPLRSGDSINLREAGREPPKLFLPEQNRPAYASDIVVRAVLSHETDRFTPDSVLRFFAESYRVSPKSDRMGCRLEGPPLAHVHGADILSAGVQTGTVQIPGDGLPIVLLAERQTTGGYTRIAHVIRADLPKLGQARPGDAVRFVRCSVEDAQAAWRKREAEIGATILPSPDPGAPAVCRANPDFKWRTARWFRVTVNGRAYDVEVLPDNDVL